MTYTIVNPECLPGVQKVLAEFLIEQYEKAILEGRIKLDSKQDNSIAKNTSDK